MKSKSPILSPRQLLLLASSLPFQRQSLGREACASVGTCLCVSLKLDFNILKLCKAFFKNTCKKHKRNE